MHVNHMYVYHSFYIGSIAYPDARFGSGTGPIIYNNFRCTGSEASILDCTNSGFGNIGTCTHANDASVTCFERKSMERIPSNGSTVCMVSHFTGIFILFQMCVQYVRLETSGWSKEVPSTMAKLKCA